jgi:hypothetical protein
LYAASTANFRTAVMRTMIDTAPRLQPSSVMRHKATVAFVKPARGSCVMPGEKLIQPETVDAVGDRREDAIQHEAFRRSHWFCWEL